MGVTRVFSIVLVSIAMIVVGCGNDTSGDGGEAGSGGSAGSGGTAGTGGGMGGSGGEAGSGGSGGEAGSGGMGGGQGGSGGMNAGCEDDLGGMPALTGQPSVTPTTVAQLGTVTARAPVNDATKFVVAFVSSAFNELEGRNSTTTTGGETVEIEITLDGDNVGDVFFVGFQLCESEAECSGPNRNSVQYNDPRNDEPFYFISITVDGASRPDLSKISDCNEVVELTITAN